MYDLYDLSLTDLNNCGGLPQRSMTAIIHDIQGLRTQDGAPCLVTWVLRKGVSGASGNEFYFDDSIQLVHHRYESFSWSPDTSLIAAIEK